MMSPKRCVKRVDTNEDMTHKLAMDVATYGHRAAHRLDVRLLHENLACLARDE